MDKKDKFDYEALKKNPLEQLRSGKSLFGKDSAFAPLLKDILEAAMEGELVRITSMRRNDLPGTARTVRLPRSLRRLMAPSI